MLDGVIDQTIDYTRERHTFGKPVFDKQVVQYWGGMGYTRHNPVARAFRDGRLVSIGGGADEIMLSVIAGLEGTSPRSSHDAMHGDIRSARRAKL